jgi:cryptochrome
MTTDKQYIYSPHLAPEAVQKKANCIIGKDYPFPVLDERAEKDRCIARLKNAYSLHLQGDAPEVMDGTAGDMLRGKHIESGALEVKTEGEKKEEKGRAKRERDGDQSIDGFFKGKKVKKE